MNARLALPAAALLFVLLATANAGGYRYGVSDQAFYVPALAMKMDPALFPRDRALFAPQMSLWVGGDVLAGLARTAGGDLPRLFALLQIATLVVLFVAAVALSRAAGLSWWAVAAFLALLTIRHRIAKTGANSLEGYMHPRMLAFAFGVGAWAALLRGRHIWSIALVAMAAVVHVTTALWFGVALAAGALARDRHWLRWIIAAAVLAIVITWAVVRGPLAGRLATMDDAWLAVFADRDYLFPADWPIYAWATNLAYAVVIILAFRARTLRNLTSPHEALLVRGLLALVAVFLISVPFTQARIALAVQLQVNRVFWLLDVVALMYVAWWVLDRAAAGLAPRTRAAIVGALVLAAAARGAFILHETGRPLAEVSLPAGSWSETMAWLRTQPVGWHVLADPGHGYKFGSSVRVAAWRDVLLEAGKDPALALYGRDVAMRVAERTHALTDFDRLTPASVRDLASRYALDVFVDRADRSFDLPVLYRNREFVVYDLRR